MFKNEIELTQNYILSKKEKKDFCKKFKNIYNDMKLLNLFLIILKIYIALKQTL